MTQLSPLQHYWHAQDYPGGVDHQWEAGVLSCWFRRDGREWSIARDTANRGSEPSPGAAPAPPAGMTWERWAFSYSSPRLEVQPAMPDRPLLVKTLTPLRLPPESRIDFYISIPVSATFCVHHGDKPTEIARYPTTPLASTWFGSPFGSGLLCYAIKSRAKLSLDEVTDSTHRAICPFRVHNRDKAPLLIESICVQTRHLSIYAGMKRLWTNPVQATFRGPDHDSQLDYAHEAPPECRQPSLLRPAEAPPTTGFLNRTLHFNPFTSNHP